MESPTWRYGANGLMTTIRELGQPKALITGIARQDGSYLAELLLEKG